jgi:hypothetical protein
MRFLISLRLVRKDGGEEELVRNDTHSVVIPAQGWGKRGIAEQ